MKPIVKFLTKGFKAKTLQGRSNDELIHTLNGIIDSLRLTYENTGAVINSIDHRSDHATLIGAIGLLIKLRLNPKCGVISATMIKSRAPKGLNHSSCVRLSVKLKLSL